MLDQAREESHSLSGALFLNPLPTSLGTIHVGVNSDKVCFLSFVGDKFEEWRRKYASQCVVSRDDFSHPIFSQIREFLAGDRQCFDVDVQISGTPFQRSVYQILLQIPYGETISYAEIGRRLGDEHLGRAVGNASGQNPIALILPCHRVVGSDGKLRGFSGGIPVKKALLRLEYQNTTKQLDLLGF